MGLGVICFLSFPILQFFWNVVSIIETMSSPSPSAGIKWGNYYEVPFLCFFPLCNPLYPYDLVLKERMGLGWIPLFMGVFSGQGFPQFSLLSSGYGYVNLESQMKCSWQPHWTYPPAPARQRLPYHFHRNFSPVKNSFVMWSFIGKGNVLRIFYSSVCYESSLLLSDTRSDFWPSWWSWLSECWTMIPCSGSEVVLNLVSSW